MVFYAIMLPMGRHKGIVIRNTIIVVIALSVANGLRFTDLSFVGNCIARLFSLSIYMGLVGFWGISLMKRIMHVKIRRYLIATDFAMFFILVVRAFMLYVFTGYGKTVCRFLAVFSEIFIFLIVVRISVILIRDLEIFKVFREARIDIRLLAPLVIILVSFACFAGYIINNPGEGNELFEFSAAFATFTIAFYESFIQTGLIPSNIDYDWCFNNSSVAAQILDKNGETVYRSAQARKLSKDKTNILMCQGLADGGPHTELVSRPIKGGFVVWERDVSEIKRSISKLEETNDSVKEAAEALEENIELEKKRKRIGERNRLYDITFSNVSSELSKLHKLIDEAHSLEGEDLYRKLRHIDILGVYVKRTSNLLLLSEQTLKDFSGELRLCFKETFDNLKDSGLAASFMFRRVENMDYVEADTLYELLETSIEPNIYNLKSVNAILVGTGVGFTLTLNLETLEPITDFYFLHEARRKQGLSVDHETDGTETTLSFELRVGGGK